MKRLTSRDLIFIAIAGIAYYAVYWFAMFFMLVTWAFGFPWTTAEPEPIASLYNAGQYVLLAGWIIGVLTCFVSSTYAYRVIAIAPIYVAGTMALVTVRLLFL